MPPTALTILAVCAVALTGCAAFSNQEANTSAAASTENAEPALRTDASTPAPNPPPTVTALPAVGTVSLAIEDRVGLGQIIVDSAGHTLYAFTQDRPNEPTCYDACAKTWPPLLAKGDPSGTIGIDVASVQVVPRHDGGNQVTYKGIPLYQYAGDETDRDANGQGLDMFGGEWHVLTKEGQPLA